MPNVNLIRNNVPKQDRRNTIKTNGIKEILNILNNPSKEDKALITKAYNYAEEVHRNHKRKSGEPYFNHPFETAKLLAGLNMGPRTIAAGFLHDTIEDVGIKEEEIEKKFGKEVLFLVQGVTKLGTLRYRGAKRHVESLRRLLVATSQDIRVLIVKLMDRLHNMKTLDHVPKNKQKKVALETLEIYAPIADRLGMGQIKRELEDLAFPYVYPKEYEEVKALLKQTSRGIEHRLDKIHKSLKKEFAKHDIRDFRTEHRIKGLYSLFRKLERKGNDIEKIYDIAALRIIVPTIDDCYKVLGIIHNTWRPLPGKIKDYIAFPKPNGYRSIHTTIFTGDGRIVEVQIQTEIMHREARFGIASHLSYKEGGSQQNRQQARLNLLWIKQLIPSLLKIPKAEKDASKSAKKKVVKKKPLSSATPLWIREITEAHQEDSPQTSEFLTSLKTDFFSHRVFVFTPKGDVIDLPINSSPIDFAYAVHSDIGNHIAGAKVNGKMTALDTKLKNGDIVEIVTKPGSRPTQKWLDFAKTTLAKKKIHAALHMESV